MYIHEHVALVMARERIQDAARAADRARAADLPRGPRVSARVRLGTALIRLGRWIQGQHSQFGTSAGLHQA
jgi:hypothetical protein